MAILGFEVEELARVLALMGTSDLEEIEWERPGRYLKVGSLRTPGQEPSTGAGIEPAIAPLPARLPQTRRGAEQKSIAPRPAAEIAEDEIALVSPMVGVFYRTGRPGDEPLVDIGQVIKQDQPIGIIEAMKIFSEIPAEHSGIVVAIPANDGQLVQAGTPLVIVRRQA